MSRLRWVVAATLLLCILAATPGLSAASTAPAGTVAQAPQGPTPSSELPAALQTSWANRSGFVSGVAANAGSQAPVQGPVSVVLTLWPSNLSLFLPRSASEAPLSPAQFEQEYSPSVAEYQDLIQYFEGHGLSVAHTWADRLSLTVSGPASNVGAAFDTSLLQGTVAGRPVQYPAAVPSLPAALEADVSAISGLSSGFSSFTLPIAPVSPSLLNSSGLTPDFGTTTEVTPTGAHAAYDLDALYNMSGKFHGAAGQNIVLLLWGDGYAPSDLSTFFSKYYPSSFPAPTIRAFPIDGAPEPNESAVDDPSDAPQELTLDMEWSGSMAPGATLDAVYAPDGPAPTYSPDDGPMEDALAYAVNNITNVSVISMSFGLPETEDPSFQAAYTTLFAAAESRGITVVSASGDDGGSQLSHGACTATPEIEFPASSPDVLAVGGTAPTLNVSDSGAITGIATQPAWNLSGGGLSEVYPAPSWQLVGSAKTVIGSGGRGVPDVAGPAADNFIYYKGATGQLAGTSFATPFWAGILTEIDAIRGQTLGFVTPRLYALASQQAGGASAPFSDVTSGSSCLHPALSGWDEVTGWGTPRGFDLYAALTSTFVDLTVTASPSTVFPGGSTTVTVRVLNATSGAPISGLPVEVGLAATSGYSGPCGGTFGATVAVVTNAQGVGTSRFSVPYCYFGSQADVSAVLLSGGYFGQATATVSVSLLSGSGFLSLVSTFPYNVIFFGLIVILAILIGLLFSARSRHRRSLPPAYPAMRPAPPAQPPSWVRAPPPSGPATPGPTPAYASPAAPPPGAVASAPPDVGPTPSYRPPVSYSPPAPVRCPSCGTMIPAYSLSCPRCGLARP